MMQMVRLKIKIRNISSKWILPHEFPTEFQDKLHAGIIFSKSECGWTWDIFYQQAIQYTITNITEIVPMVFILGTPMHHLNSIMRMVNGCKEKLSG